MLSFPDTAGPHQMQAGPYRGIGSRLLAPPGAG